MSKLVYPALAVVLVVACGGTTDGNGAPSGAAGSSGANSSAGSLNAGSSAGGASAGTASGGTASAGGAGAGSAGKAGSSAGGAGSAAGGGAGGVVSSGGVAGASAGSGGNGGAGGVDSRCPSTAPTGTCSDEQAEALCEYDANGCLCSLTGSALSFCAKVDPTCPSGGAANAPAPEPPGGSSSKIALPTTRRCRCSGGSWQCSP